MSVTIGSVALEHDAPTVLLLGPLPGPAQVTLHTTDITFLHTTDITFLASEAGVDPRTQPDQVFEIAAQPGQPLQLNLHAGDTLYAAPLANNGNQQVSYFIAA